MAIQESEQPEIGILVKAILLSSVMIVLPGLEWSFLGWSQMFLPLLAFSLLGRFGGYTGRRILLSAAVIAGIAYMALGRIEMFLFSGVLLFSGLILFRSAERRESPAASGLKAALTLTGGWVLVMAVLSIGSETSMYGQLLKTLDQSIVEALGYYRQNNTVSSDTMVMVEETLYRMRALIPVIMPAVLGSMVLLVTWVTMVIGNLLRLKAIEEDSAWASYRYWQLPEKLIWLVIVMGALTLIPSGLRTLGVNSLILLAIVYCFQGLAIVVFFMNKWNVPLLLRSFFYVMFIFQSLGTLVLLCVGIADTWLDIRKLRPPTTDNNAHNTTQ